jgi:hypothetical protein
MAARIAVGWEYNRIGAGLQLARFRYKSKTQDYKTQDEE